MNERKKPIGEVSAEDLHAAIMTFLKQSAIFSDAAATEEDMRRASLAIREIMPTLRAAGIMRAFRVKNTKLRQQLAPKTKGAGKAGRAAAAGGADAG